jgi:outer membrane protein insertion porin family
MMPGWWCGFAQSQPARRPPQRKAAEAAAPAPTRWPIATLAVEGARHYSREQVVAVAGLKIGQMAGKTEFDAARDRLLASGAFDNVSYRFTPSSEGGGYAAVFQVTEAEPAYPARFEDLGISAGEAERALSEKDPLFLKDWIPATKPVLDRYAGWLQERLAAAGIKEKVTAQVAPPPAGGGFVILFRPARNRPAVAEVSFEGNQVVPERVLREAVAGTAIGAPYTEESFRELLGNALRPVYEARGRVRVTFPKIHTEPAKDTEGLAVMVTVDEGQSYTLGKVAVEGPTPLRPEDLLKAGDIKTGDVANFNAVAEGLERMRHALRRAGYMQGKVTSERRIDDAKRTIDLALHVDSGPQFLMGKLEITGLDLDSEAEIRRIWGMKEGKPFNADYPDRFLASVREQGLFDNLGKTRAEISTDDARHVTDVKLVFTGEPGGGNARRHGRLP